MVTPDSEHLPFIAGIAGGFRHRIYTIQSKGVGEDEDSPKANGDFVWVLDETACCFHIQFL